MRRPGWRTRLAYVLRTWWRRLRIAWYDVQVWAEEMWRRHIVDEEPQAGIVFAIPWTGAHLRPRYRDGQADVYVSPGTPADMVAAYLHILHRPAPREVIQ